MNAAFSVQSAWVLGLIQLWNAIVRFYFASVQLRLLIGGGL